MHKSKLIRLLKSLTPEEFKEFSKFIKSPYFNTNKNYLPFYNLLKKYYPYFNSSKLTKEQTFKKIFSSKKYNYNIMANLMSGLTSLTEEYLLHIQLQKNERAKKELLLNAYGDRNLYPFFKKETERQLEELEKSPYRDVEHYGEKARLNFDYFFHTLTDKHTLKDDTLVNLMDSIDKQFVLAKLRIGSEFKNRERTLTKKYDIRFSKEILAERNRDWIQGDIFETYQLLFRLYANEAEDSVFFILKKQLSKKIKNLRRLDQSLLITQLINYGIRQIHVGKSEFYTECFDLYKMGLSHHLVLESKRMNEAVYGNIVLLGCHAQEFDWTEKFIEEYAGYLEEEKRDDAKALSKGTWYFHKKEFEKAHDLFFHHSFTHFYQPKVRLFLTLTLYERHLTNETLFEPLISHIDAFTNFIYRNNLMVSDQKDAYLNSLQIIKKMATYVLERKKGLEIKSRIEEKMMTKGKLINKIWIKQKLDQLTT